MKIHLNSMENIICENCNSLVIAEYNYKNKLKLVSLKCSICNKETPLMEPGTVFKYWNLIEKNIHYKSRSLAYSPWGICTSKPQESIKEKNKFGFINLDIYNDNGIFFYGYQLKIKKIIRAKAATVFNQTYNNIICLKNAAKEEIEGIFSSNRNTKKIFKQEFIIFSGSQLELF